MHARDVLGAAEARLTLTEYELGEYPSTPGKRRFDKIARFSTIGPVKAGWMVKSKGTWTLTDEGWLAYEQIPDPAEFMRESSRRYYAWKRAQPADDATADEPGIEGDDVEITSSAAATLEEATEVAWSEIEAYLRRVPRRVVVALTRHAERKGIAVGEALDRLCRAASLYDGDGRP